MSDAFMKINAQSLRSGSWIPKELNAPAYDKAFRDACDVVYPIVARRMREHLFDTIETAGASAGVVWPPLARSTIVRKGHAAPLQDTGDFMDSITFWRAGHGIWHIGHRPGQKHKFARDVLLRRMAEWHEFGTRPSQRRSRRSRGPREPATNDHPKPEGVRKKQTQWHIPPRPVFGPTYSKHFNSEIAHVWNKLRISMIAALSKRGAGSKRALRSLFARR